MLVCCCCILHAFTISLTCLLICVYDSFVKKSIRGNSSKQAFKMIVLLFTSRCVRLGLLVFGARALCAGGVLCMEGVELHPWPSPTRRQQHSPILKCVRTSPSDLGVRTDPCVRASAMLRAPSPRCLSQRHLSQLHSSTSTQLLKKRLECSSVWLLLNYAWAENYHKF